MSCPPPVTHMLETIIYVKSLPEAEDFYTNIIGLKRLNILYGVGAAFALGEGVLLLFVLGKTIEDRDIAEDNPKQRIPGHGPTKEILDLLGEGKRASAGSLRQHYCFSVKTPEDAKAWERYLEGKNVKILGNMDWGKRGYSVYFADPDGNVGEVASARLWDSDMFEG